MNWTSSIDNGKDIPPMTTKKKNEASWRVRGKAFAQQRNSED